MVHIVGGVVWLVFWALALFVPGIFWVWGGRGVFSASETVYAMRLPVWLLIAFFISQSWLTHTRFATAEWRRFLRTAVVAAGLALALFLLRGGRHTGRGSQLGSHSGQVAGDAESDDRGRPGAGLCFRRPAVSP